MTPLMCACAAGKAHTVDILLKKKASFKHRGEGEMSALHWASFHGHAEAVDRLLQKKAPINASNKDGRTPLHLAVMAEEFAVADLLLRKGAPVEAPCNSGLKSLHYACTRANPEVAQLLLGYNANLEAEDGSRSRPLHKACYRGSLPHVELLIQKGVSIDPRNSTGDRPLCVASSMGHVDIVRALLNRGAALRSKFAAGPSHEDSPLCLAAKHGHVPVIEELLMRGASVLQKDERDWQPLRYAAFHAHPRAVEVLLKHGATVSGGASGGWGFEITAHRIGFENDVSIEEQRKGEVMRLLTNAEARERKPSEYAAAAVISMVPPAVQNQTVPTELPGLNTVKSRSQRTQTAPMPFPQRNISEMNAESSRSPIASSPEPEGHQYYSEPPKANVPARAEPPVQQVRSLYHLENPSDPRHFDVNGVPQATAQASPLVMPSDQGYYFAGYQNSVAASTPFQPAASYNFVPKPMSHTSPSGSYNPALQYQPMATAYASMPGTATAPTMTLGPDGLWRQIPSNNSGVQRVPSHTSAVRSPAAPASYPNGVYEMAS